MTQNKLLEPFVVYFSSDDGCYLAHGLRTDEVGTGDSVVDAIADLLKTHEQILRLAAREPDVNIFRKAPGDIQRKAKSAAHLPQELYEIAYRRVHGEWPKEFEVHVTSPKTRRCYRYPAQPLETSTAK